MTVMMCWLLFFWVRYDDMNGGPYYMFCEYEQYIRLLYIIITVSLFDKVSNTRRSMHISYQNLITEY